MTRAEFLDAIAAAKIDPKSFNLDGEGDECHVLSNEKHVWSVYYSERGLEREKHDFATEGAALEYLMVVLKGDPSTRSRT